MSISFFSSFHPLINRLDTAGFSDLFFLFYFRFASYFFVVFVCFFCFRSCLIKLYIPYLITRILFYHVSKGAAICVWLIVLIPFGKNAMKSSLRWHTYQKHGIYILYYKNIGLGNSCAWVAHWKGTTILNWSSGSRQNFYHHIMETAPVTSLSDNVIAY